MIAAIPFSTDKPKKTEIIDPSILSDYPYLLAALQDVAVIRNHRKLDYIQSRHVICLMFDSIEFILYQILILRESDHYKNGQNTIGLDDAIAACERIGVKLPRIDIIRRIQKFRGDAKHHAQSLSGAEFDNIYDNFGLIITRIVHEQFGDILGDKVKSLPIEKHSVALRKLYSRFRNNHWERACSYILACALARYREMFGLAVGVFPDTMKIRETYGALQREISGREYPGATKSATDAVINLDGKVSHLIKSQRWEECAEIIAKFCDDMEGLCPSIFDINSAKMITPNLYIPRYFTSASGAWSKSFGTEKTAPVLNVIKDLLKEDAILVKSFGRPHEDIEEDNIRRWWEFALLCDEQWTSVHINTRFDVWTESSLDKERTLAVLKCLSEELLLASIL